MQSIRHLNLFGKITRVDTKFYFKYNGGLIFCVPRHLVSKAIGEKGNNVREISGILKKRVKIIPSPDGLKDIRIFFEKVVEPVEIRGMEVEGNTLLVSATRQSKAALIGRDKRRLIELQKIIKDFFSKELRIV